MAFVRFQQLDGFCFGVGVGGSDACYEDGEDDFASVEVASGHDGHCEREDVRDAGVGIGCERGLVGAGNEALAGEHGGSGVDCHSLVE